ncbi:ECF transporter S component [Leuconostoc rapi]|uniref:ECF transporter S component n=1 Tax=Leuconostoc rapi TaxID=1406906 RepID=UPI0019599E3F|nr:ECF transporter S component [Leuconostoc rapi]MBM7436494.1 putative membrane protein [Leuconostoc rapi]
MRINQKTQTIVFVAFFAAITYVATSIQVPMPALIGKPFVHLGNAAALLSVLLLGYKRGAFAGGVGLALFDVTHNYVLDAPYYFFEIFIVGGIAIIVFNMTHYRVAPKPIKLVTVIAAAIVTKFVTTTLHNFVMGLVKGLTFQPAVIATLSALMPTVINCATTMLVVLITYPILHQQLRTKLTV